MMFILPALVSVALVAGTEGAPGTLVREAAASQILALHREMLDARRAGDVDRLLARDAADYVVVRGADVSYPTPDERRARAEADTKSMRFESYADAVEPVVEVSADGTLGWVITRVRAEGVHYTENGPSERVALDLAWIELYEKREQRWYRVGTVIGGSSP